MHEDGINERPRSDGPLRPGRTNATEQHRRIDLAGSIKRAKCMTTIHKILFPVDFTPSCLAMAPFVKKGAAMFSAKVTLLHVLDLSSSGFELLVRPQREVEEDREQVARAKLESFLESEFLPRESSRLLRVGDAATRIAEVAREGRFGLI